MNDVDVAAPEKWMKGWDRIYRQMLEMSDDELKEIEAVHVIRQLRHAFAVADVNPEDLEVLEVASGDGQQACYLGNLGCHVLGVDALESAVIVSRKRSRLLSLNDKVNFELRNMDGWEIESDSYDIVVAIQCLQYLFERTIPRLRELIAAVKPGGFFVYSGNVLPHKETDPPIRFITREELEDEFSDWNFHSFGSDEILINKDDLRGYVWLVARRPS